MGVSKCGPRPALEGGRAPRKNAASRRRYRDRRASRLCVDCSEHAGVAARCTPCAYRFYVSSGEHKGIPLYPPRYTVIELATGEDLGPWENWEEVSICLAFTKLSQGGNRDYKRCLGNGDAHRYVELYITVKRDILDVALAILGKVTLDVYLNDRAFMRDVAAAWHYKLYDLYR